jgi:hypothetical protein
MPPLASPAAPETGEILAIHGFSAEFRLLLAACRDDGSQSDRTVAVLREPLDWERVFSLAEFHGVVPLLHRTLNGHAPSPAPLEIRQALQARFDLNVRKNLLLAAELFGILDCLEGAGISAVPYKGPVLAESIYGDLAMRDFSDLDVLVAADDVPRARRALATIGFAPNITLTEPQERDYLASGYEYTFDTSIEKNLLEIQWNFVPRFFAVDFDMQAVLGRCTTRPVAGRTVRALGDEDLLLALCVHAAKHLWNRLGWLCDIAALLKRSSIAWQQVAIEAKQLGIGRILAINLLLAQRLLGAQTPLELRDTLRSEAENATGICGEIEKLMPEDETRSTESMAYIRWMLRLRGRVSDRARFLTRLAFTPSIGEWQWITLPGALFPLYRMVRMVRLAGRLGGTR